MGGLLPYISARFLPMPDKACGKRWAGDDLYTARTIRWHNGGLYANHVNMAFKELFIDQRDRARVLAEILSKHPAVPGATLIAHVDRGTQAVIGVRSIQTLTPVLDADDCFQYEQIRQLSDTLCVVAQELVPQRTWDGRRAGPMTGELITVVCRDGDPVITATETLYHWGWRYSNHLTAAFDGEVFVLTPQGWAGLYTDCSGSQPTLSVSTESADATQVRSAERLLTELAAARMEAIAHVSGSSPDCPSVRVSSCR